MLSIRTLMSVRRLSGTVADTSVKLSRKRRAWDRGRGGGKDVDVHAAKLAGSEEERREDR